MQTTTQTVTVHVPKSMGLAYVLLIFLGQLGIHRFYLGRTGTAVAQLLLGIIGTILLFVGIGFFLLITLWIWLLVDLFLIPSMARSGNGVMLQATTVTTSEANKTESN